MESIVTIIGLLLLFSLAGVMVVDSIYRLISKIKQDKLDELQRYKIARSLDTIATYYYYKGKNEGINMDIE